MSQLYRHNIRRFSRIYNNVSETIGNTPIIKINKLAPPNIDMYVKCEFFNPLSSVKDRLGIAIIEAAERDHKIKPGDTIIEATSGNTGISLAMVCAQKGYNFVTVMAESFSLERRKIIRALGGKVILTPAPAKAIGMLTKTMELVETHGWFYTNQFNNPANPEYHANTTGPEILTSFVGRNLDYWVTGYGTGGTFTGAGRVLKAARPDLKVILTEPENARLVGSGIPQKVTADGLPAEGHPAWNFHPIQGWAPNFIPKVCQDGLDDGVADEVHSVNPEVGIQTALDLAKKEGIFTGISGGSTLATALEVAKTAKDGSGILAMLPDTGERYLSTVLFDKLTDDMDEEEREISLSTPSFQMSEQMK